MGVEVWWNPGSSLRSASRLIWRKPLCKATGRVTLPKNPDIIMVTWVPANVHDHLLGLSQASRANAVKDFWPEVFTQRRCSFQQPKLLVEWILKFYTHLLFDSKVTLKTTSTRVQIASVHKAEWTGAWLTPWPRLDVPPWSHTGRCS